MVAVMKIPKFANMLPSAVELAVAVAARRTAVAGQELMQQVIALELSFIICDEQTGRGQPELDVAVCRHSRCHC
jgi:hypothetical protein